MYPLLVLSFALAASAQSNDVTNFAATLSNHYRVYPDITYRTANNVPLKLDVYQPVHSAQPTPVLVRIHGGGWVEGRKEENTYEFLPFVQTGWAVVNVEYRLGRVSLAPAAVEDCRCALHWVFANAAKYNFDVHRVVTFGGSAGGHLALTTGMLPHSAGFDRTCRAGEASAWVAEGGTAGDPPVAAILNWFGITDVADMLRGPHARGYAIEWIGAQPNADELARQLSPLTYVRKGMPPVFTVHGDSDKLVPYEQAVRLHKALDAAGVPNQLMTIPGGGHGGFTDEQTLQIFTAIRAFLDKNIPASPTH